MGDNLKLFIVVIGIAAPMLIAFGYQQATTDALEQELSFHRSGPPHSDVAERLAVMETRMHNMEGKVNETSKNVLWLRRHSEQATPRDTE